LSDTVKADTIGSVLQVSASLAGLLLVFIGFVFARAESFSTKRGDVYRHVARGDIIPFFIALACAWWCVDFLLGDGRAFDFAILSFRASLIVTGLYAFVVLFMYLG
jgi:hypothetical protein